VHRPAGAGGDVGELAGVGVERLLRDDAVAGGLLGEVQLGIPGLRRPVGLRRDGVGELELVAGGVVAVGDGKARGLKHLADA
jgi:hypothetical protein